MTTQLLRLRVSRLATLLFLLNISLVLNAQIQWQHTLGGSQAEEHVTSCLTSNGILIAATSASGVSGTKTTVNNGNTDAWLTQHDASGAILWQKTLGGADYEAASSVIATADGGILVAITSASGISGDRTETSRGSYDFWLVKLDALGNIQWQKAYGGAGQDWAASVQELPNNGGYIVGGYSDSGVSGEKTTPSNGGFDYWLLKIDANGNLIWDKTYGFNGDETLMNCQITSDGGIILSGYLYNTTNSGMTVYGSTDMYVVKTDANGTVVWQKIYGGSGEDYASHISENTDGSFTIAGVTNSGVSGVKTEPHCGGAYDIWMLTINNLGTILWQNTIGTNGYDAAAKSVQTPDGGHLVFGSSEGGVNGDKTLPTKGESDFWLIKLNGAGAIEWQQVVGGSDNDNILTGHLLPDQTIFAAGMSMSGISGDKTTPNYGDNDVWTVKIGSNAPPATPSVSNRFLCQNSPATPLTATGQNLLWYTAVSGGVGSSTAPTPATTTVGTTTYYVSQTINGIESPRAALTVTINASPTATITGFNTRCSYQTSPTTISAVNNSAWQYTWNTGATGSFISVSPSLSTTYSVTVTHPNGCTATASATLPVINITAQIVSANSFCKNVSSPLTATGGTSYVWSTGHTAATINQSLTQPKTFSVTVSQSGCSRVATKTIAVDQPFTAQITNLNGSYPQNAASVTLTGTPTGGSFTIDNQPAAILNPATLSLGSHTVRYTVSQGACTSTRGQSVAINAPTVNLLIPTNNTYFSAKPELNAVKLDWVNNRSDADFFVVQKRDNLGQFIDIQIVNAKNNDRVTDINTFVAQDLQPTEGDNIYRVKTVFADGSAQFSELRTVKFGKLEAVSVFPNPASDALDVRLDTYLGKPATLEFYNTFGQMVMSQKTPTVQNGIEHLNISELKAGMYQLRISSPNKRDVVVKIVVNK